MIFKLEKYNGIHRIVSLALDEDTYDNLLKEDLDFIYVDDAARAILMLADKGRNGEIYNVSSGKAKKLKDYIESIHNKINPNIEIGYGDLKNSGNIMYLKGDITKIKNEVGFEPVISFDKGIDMTIEWAREYYL